MNLLQMLRLEEKTKAKNVYFQTNKLSASEERFMYRPPITVYFTKLRRVWL